MSQAAPQLIAGGAIRAHRFVKMDTSEDHQCLEANANERVVGITGDATMYPPLSDLVSTNNAAADGTSLLIYGENDICLVEAAGTFTAGAMLKSDNEGAAVAAETTGATMQNHGAQALQSGVDGALVRVVIKIEQVYPALA